MFIKYSKANLLLVLGSVLFSIILFEIIASQIFNIPNFNDLELRYKINGIKTFSPGFYQKSSSYPIKGKKNINILYEDMRTHPISSRVETDSLGYRNSKKHSENAKIVLVGDSVAFGYGLSNNEMISSILEPEIGEKIYNLSVSGWGPASYMKAVGEYAKHNAFDSLIVLYFTGNDDANLNNSCWPELAQCKAPSAGKITRSDMASYTIYAPHNALVVSPLRYSSLAYLIFSYFNDTSVQIFKQENMANPTPPSKKNIAEAIESLNYLSQGHCVNDEEKIEINKIKLLISNNNFLDADLASYNLSVKLISKNCAPLILNDMGGKANYVTISRFKVSKLNLPNKTTKISPVRENFSCEFQCNAYSKKKIFINWLNEMKNIYKVSMVILPAEYQIAYLTAKNQLHWTCKIQPVNFNCIDLRDEMYNFYSQNKDALYHDQSHLNNLGVKFIVDKIKLYKVK